MTTGYDPNDPTDNGPDWKNWEKAEHNTVHITGSQVPFVALCGSKLFNFLSAPLWEEQRTGKWNHLNMYERMCPCCIVLWYAGAATE